MNQDRIKKMESKAQRLLSEIIFEEIEDSEKIFGIITITRVKISSDLSYLDVFLSSFKEKKILPKTLAKHGYDIQKRFNQKIDLIKIPKIRFRYDDSGENYVSIDSLLREIKEEIDK
ncbi:30S ribosome-binding factor RbfA [Candidatus Gracilibacteria bacterium]|nr:30S ribosome-binding factor RbfA [Candidatus Gracilibacteria bacterium]